MVSGAGSTSACSPYPALLWARETPPRSFCQSCFCCVLLSPLLMLDTTRPRGLCELETRCGCRYGTWRAFVPSSPVTVRSLPRDPGLSGQASGTTPRGGRAEIFYCTHREREGAWPRLDLTHTDCWTRLETLSHLLIQLRTAATQRPVSSEVCFRVLQLQHLH